MVDSAYVERPPAPELAQHVQCFWYRRVGAAELTRPRPILPDGCMDLIWMNGKLVVAGPDRTVQYSVAAPGAEIVGVRFRPGAATPVLGIPAVELVDLRVDATDLWGRATDKYAARLSDLRCPSEAAEVLQDAVRERLVLAPERDYVVRRLVVSVERAGGHPDLRVERLAKELGISERQLLRRCSSALGYGPKTFARIVRFQRFLADARSPQRSPLSVLAAHSGYADQAHLTREVRRLSGMSPTALVADLTR